MPNSTQYSQAIQNLSLTAGDSDLQSAQAATSPLGLPIQYSGNFAVVYKVTCHHTGKSWAVKCFIRDVAHRQERYETIARHLSDVKLPFMVGFDYQERGILVGNTWQPIVKMDWVDGDTLNEFVAANANDKAILKQLAGLWIKLAARLNQARVTHSDLQHGNVLLVPASNPNEGPKLRLVDYDGIHIPKLSDLPSGEFGHRNYQHPSRDARRVYSDYVDKFSHLVIYTALQSTACEGSDLWHRFDDDENLLFRESDFRAPKDSAIFHELWALPDPAVHAAVGRLILATANPIEETPSLDVLHQRGSLRQISKPDEQQVELILRGVEQVSVATTKAKDAVVTSTVTTKDLEPNSLDDADSRSLAEVEHSTYSSSQRLWTASVAGMGLVLLLAACSIWIYRRNSNSPLTDVRRTTAFSAKTTDSSVLDEPKPTPSVALETHREEDLGNTQSNSRDTNHEFNSLPKTTSSADVVLPQSLENSIGMKLALIPSGEFNMGLNESNVRDRERPHNVRITKAFYIGVVEVTIPNWERVMDTRPYRHVIFPANDGVYPACNMTWNEAAEFCKTLSEIENRRYRLPTEAEWEYACRAGKTTQYGFGNDTTELPNFAWTAENTYKAGLFSPQECGKKNPNAFGLYDMHGNVGEWCHDWFSDNYYLSSPDVDPTGPNEGFGIKVYRGGTFNHSARVARSGQRMTLRADYNETYVGFRVVLETDGLDHTNAARTQVEKGEMSPDVNHLKSETAGVQKETNISPPTNTPPELLQLILETRNHLRNAEQNSENPAIDITQLFRAISQIATYELAPMPVELDALLLDVSRSPVRKLVHNTSMLCWKLPTIAKSVFVLIGTPCLSGQDSAIFIFDNGVPRLIRVRLPSNLAFQFDKDVILIGIVDELDSQRVRVKTLKAIDQQKLNGNEARFDKAEIENSIRQELVLIPPGVFMMGFRPDLAGQEILGSYQQQVRITKPFYMATEEVTQYQWRKIMENEPWENRSDTKDGHDLAASYISWNDATEFCKRLSVKDDRAYRLPTEAEWEYSCRANTQTRFSFGDDESELSKFAWTRNNNARSQIVVERVGQLLPNDFGLFDMHGNVSEWCADLQDSLPLDGSTLIDPFGDLANSKMRKVRGGDIRSDAESCRSACRLTLNADTDYRPTGVRVVADIEPLTRNAECIVAYSFDQDMKKTPDGSSLSDISGNHLDGEWRNLTARQGVVNRAVEFSGSGQSFVKLPDEEGQYPVNEFSVLAWIWIPDLPKSPATILDLNYAASGRNDQRGGCRISINPTGRLELVIPHREAKELKISGSEKIQPNRWTHIAICKRPASVDFFVDGEHDRHHELKTRYPVVYSYKRNDDNSVNLGISKRAGLSLHRFAGRIDEFALIRHALTHFQVAAIRTWQQAPF